MARAGRLFASAGGLEAREFYGREARALTRPTALAFCVSQFFGGAANKRA